MEPRARNLLGIAFLLLIGTVMLYLLPLFSKSKPQMLIKEDWPTTKLLLKEAQQKPDCYEMFMLLWPHVKAENLEARAYLAMLLAPPIHGDRMILPGENDYYINFRNIATLFVYSTGWVDNGKEDFFKEHALQAFPYLWPYLPTKEFIECFKDEYSQSCADIAIRNKMVPKFSNFTAQIDDYIAKGFIPACYVHPDEYRNKNWSLELTQ